MALIDGFKKLPPLIILNLMARLSGMIIGELLSIHQNLASIIHHCQTMSNFIKSLKPFYTGCSKKGTLATIGDTDEMQHYSAFHQGLHCLLRLKQPSGTEIHHNVYFSTCDPLKYIMGSHILIEKYMRKSIGIQKVNSVEMGRMIKYLDMYHALMTQGRPWCFLYTHTHANLQQLEINILPKTNSFLSFPINFPLTLKHLNLINVENPGKQNHSAI